jgi:hypothetical protein
MSFLADLRRELARNGIRGGLAQRIELELADHLACDPEAKLGTPAEIAERFASELRVVRTRRASIGTFAALALSGSLLCLAVLAGARVGSYGGLQRSVFAPLSALGMIAFGQIALVAGTLALLRGLRPGGTGDLALAQRRAVVALAAGGLASACLAVNAIAAPQMPLWWRTFALASALLPLPALEAAHRATRAASSITPRGEAAVGLERDLGLRPSFALVALGATAVAVMDCRASSPRARSAKG